MFLCSALEVLRWRHLPNGFEQKRSEGHLTLHPSGINPYHIWFFHVHSYRPQNPHRKLQEKNWWKGQVMKSGDLPGFGWMPTIDPSKAWGISCGHEGTHRPMSLCLGTLGWMEDHQGGQPCHRGTKNPRPCL